MFQARTLLVSFKDIVPLSLTRRKHKKSEVAAGKAYVTGIWARQPVGEVLDNYPPHIVCIISIGLDQCRIALEPGQLRSPRA